MVDTTKPEKYYFDLHIFDEPEADEQQEEEDKKQEEEAEPPPPTYSQEELDEAREQGRVQGKQEGRDEAYNQLEASMNKTLEALGDELQKLKIREETRERAYEKEVLDLVRKLLDTLFPRLAHHYGREEMLHFIHEVVRGNGDETKIRIDVSQQEHEKLQPYIQNYAPEGLLEVREAEDLAVGDCRIEWRDGGAVRDQSAQLEAIRTHFDAILAEDGDNVHNSQSQGKSTSESGDQTLKQEDKSHE